MDWQTWKPWYEKIVADFGYDIEMDRKAARILSDILKDKNTLPEEELACLFRGREAVVFGPADPDVAADENTETFGAGENQVKIAAGSGLSTMLHKVIKPDIIVTDLDGDIETLIELNVRGVIVIVHSHSDNVEKMRETVPKLAGPVFGTTQVEDVGVVRNFGGFTDGDRAVFLALCFGARKIVLKGFDFDAPVAKAGADLEAKKKKLAYAKKLIELAAEHYNIEIEY